MTSVVLVITMTVVLGDDDDKFKNYDDEDNVDDIYNHVNDEKNYFFPTNIF